ncbi:hypothetical protein GCM10008020_13570 [Massilia psychrophila]|nr:hypothetical protein GCM10008020_13570 [Massilia psychrophila]
MTGQWLRRRPRLFLDAGFVLPAQTNSVAALHKLLLEFLAELPGHAGYDTAVEAIRQIEAREPDLALLDITMPGMSGLELARHLHENTTAKWASRPPPAARLMPAFEAGLARADEIGQLRRTETNLSAARPCAFEPAQDQPSSRPVAGGRGSAQQPACGVRRPL